MIGPTDDYLAAQLDQYQGVIDEEDEDELEVYDCVLCFRTEQDCRCNAEEVREAA